VSHTNRCRDDESVASHPTLVLVLATMLGLAVKPVGATSPSAGEASDHVRALKVFGPRRKVRSDRGADVGLAEALLGFIVLAMKAARPMWKISACSTWGKSFCE
jgi:hypothetical protein